MVSLFFFNGGGRYIRTSTKAEEGLPTSDCKTPMTAFSVPLPQHILTGTPFNCCTVLRQCEAIIPGFLFVELASNQRIRLEKPSTAPLIKMPK